MAEVPDFLAGSIAVSGDFWHFGRTPAVVGTTPQVGEHNEEILGNLLGYSEGEIAELYDQKVLGNWDHYDDVPG
jgi:crotonobetainyl-CoA:carnitine CoA-transferase CaiB-like acyl-CoA transferase